jgi:hypothetical protein
MRAGMVMRFRWALVMPMVTLVMIMITSMHVSTVMTVPVSIVFQRHHNAVALVLLVSKARPRQEDHSHGGDCQQREKTTLSHCSRFSCSIVTVNLLVILHGKGNIGLARLVRHGHDVM